MAELACIAARCILILTVMFNRLDNHWHAVAT